MLSPNLVATQQDITRVIPQLRSAYHRLAIVCGPRGSGKTMLLRALHEANNYPLLNLNLSLSERLMDVTLAERPNETPVIVRALIRETNSPVVLLDNIELLFDPALQINPLNLLQGISRNTTLVASWTGTFVNNVLSYAEAGHPEHRVYPLSPQDALVFPLVIPNR